ncbi:adhesive plaque matrix protein-like [Daphnia carinata]|uniref:adhesive plaque matrix protein-like n=1 Tax=Daphnia carinata TaxID=120202 RepID=UPI00257FD291|nr:adhesive plaque matrix protein-like [Daphnia carinata]
MKIFLFAALVAVAAAGGVYQNDPYAKGDGYQPMNYGQGYKKDNKQDYNNDYNQNKKDYSGPDYYASPQPYDFAYKVKDDYTYTNFGQQESSDGYGNVKGSYFVYLPDGTTQTVNYKADSYGYVADVQYTGEPKYGDNYAPAPYKGSSSYSSPNPSYKAPSSYPYPTPSYNAPSYKAEYPPSYPSTPYMTDKYPAPSAYPKASYQNNYKSSKQY